MSGLAGYLNEVWYGTRAGYWLRPLAAVYAAAMSVRNAAYQRGWKSVYTAPCPLLIVGNQTVGGTGKTPLVIELVRRLNALGRRPGVISRGYGARVPSDRAVLVAPDSRALDVGDEPALIARRCGVPVAVCPNRRLACEAVIAAGADVIVADDGLQHLALARDAAIDVVDGARGQGNGRCLPAGPMRTPPGSRPRTDLTVVTGRDVVLEAAGVRALADGTLTPLSAWSGRTVHAVAGIGHPERFFDSLRAAGLNVLPHARPDHAPLSVTDLAFGDEHPVVLTEKDSIKLQAAPAGVFDVPVDARIAPPMSGKIDALLATLCEGASA